MSSFSSLSGVSNTFEDVTPQSKNKNPLIIEPILLMAYTVYPQNLKRLCSTLLALKLQPSKIISLVVHYQVNLSHPEP
jgi:hypothetical protein